MTKVICVTTRWLGRGKTVLPVNQVNIGVTNSITNADRSRCQQRHHSLQLGIVLGRIWYQRTVTHAQNQQMTQCRFAVLITPCCAHRGSTGPAEPLLRTTATTNMAAANFVVITNGEGCALNGTAVASVDQPIACYVLSFGELRLVVDCR